MLKYLSMKSYSSTMGATLDALCSASLCPADYRVNDHSRSSHDCVLPNSVSNYADTAARVATISMTNLSVNIADKAVLRDVNLELHSGQVTALLGPNGAGKSTLLKSLCQEVSLASGQITVLGRPLKDWDRAQLAKSLAVLPQHASLTFPFKVFEVVQMGLYPLTLSQQQGNVLVDQQLDKVALSALKYRRYPTLSGGEKQRVQLARVLAQLAQAGRSPILLLDEPTSALDLAQQHRVLALARSLATDHNYSVIVVLHDLNLASRYADRLVILNQGIVVGDGSPSEVLTADIINQVWQYDPLMIKESEDSTPLFF